MNQSGLPEGGTGQAYKGLIIKVISRLGACYLVLLKADLGVFTLFNNLRNRLKG